jgi:hypothetical protein
MFYKKITRERKINKDKKKGERRERKNKRR